MKKLLIIFFFLTFSSSFSLANNNEKITVEEIEDIFFGKFEKKKDNESWGFFLYRKSDERRSEIKDKRKKREIEKKEARKAIQERNKLKKENETWDDFFKRIEEKEEKSPYYEPPDKRFLDYQVYKKEYLEKNLRYLNRGNAKCMYFWVVAKAGGDEKCHAQVIRAAITSSEKGKKKRPGNIFYALDAIRLLVNDQNKKFIKVFDFDESKKPVVCEIALKYDYSTGYACRAFKKSTLKKIEKFKKDPSNEKVLGHKLIKYIKNIRIIRNIEEKLGTDNFMLLGDMLNATVTDVEKNKISPDLQKRRSLLKKYSLILRGIKKKLDEDNYKSIEKDVSKLSKTYKKLNTLTTTNEIGMNVDEAVYNIFDTNKLIQKSVLNAKGNEEEKLLALSSIYFMQSLIDSILSSIPEKYYVYTKELPLDLFTKSELLELEDIIDSMINKNQEIKFAELTKSMDIINKYINATDLVKTLDNLGMKNSLNRIFTHNTATEIINQQIRDNLDKEIFKEARNIFQEIDSRELSEITKEVSKVASEISSDPSVKSTVSNSAVDREYGGQSLKKLIGAGIINR